MALHAASRYRRAVRETPRLTVEAARRGSRASRLFTTATVATVLAATSPFARAQDPKPLGGGRTVEVRGEVVETSCFLRDGSRGEGHRACALICLKNGGQLGLVEDETGTLYPFAGATPSSDGSAPARQHVAAHVVVRGQVFERAGSRVLVVQDLTRLSP